MLNVIKKGYVINFQKQPIQIFCITKKRQDPIKQEAIITVVSLFLIMKVLEPVPQEKVKMGIYSKIFLVRKQNGSFRLVVDLKFLNQFIRIEKF